MEAQAHTMVEHRTVKHGGEAGAASTTSGAALSSLPWWISAIVLLAAFLLAAGAMIALFYPAMLVSPGDEIGGAVHVYAGYLVSRNLALAIMLTVALTMGARKLLGSLMALAGFIQLLDAVMDAFEHRWPLVPVVLVLGIAFLAGAARLRGPIWKAAAWRDDSR